MRRTHGGTREDGLTLIELMVAIVLVAILGVGIYHLAAGQQRTYQAQSSRMAVHSRLVSAIEYVSDQVRRAGFGFGNCPGARVDQYDPSSTDTPPLGPSLIQAFTAYNNCNLLLTPPDSCPDGSGVDSFTVVYADDEALVGTMTMRLEQPMADSSDPAILGADGSFVAGDRVVFWEPGSAGACVVRQVTGAPVAQGTVPETYELQFAADGALNPPTNVNMFPGGGYRAGTVVSRFGPRSAPRHVAIDTTRPHPRLVTWTTWDPVPANDTADMQLVAEGIEDMQIAWACDANGNGDFEEDPLSPATFEWAGSVFGVAQVACGNRPVGVVRVTLVARSASEESGSSLGQRPAVEDRIAGAPDGFYRSVLAATLRPLNIEL